MTRADAGVSMLFSHLSAVTAISAVNVVGMVRYEILHTQVLVV